MEAGVESPQYALVRIEHMASEGNRDEVLQLPLQRDFDLSVRGTIGDVLHGRKSLCRDTPIYHQEYKIRIWQEVYLN